MATQGIAPKLSLRDWGDALRGVVMGLGDSNVGLVSAGVAFYGMLAVFPAIAAVISVYGFFADPNALTGRLHGARAIVPTDVYTLLEQQADALINAQSITLGWATLLSLMAAIGTSRAGVAALIRGLNVIYREDERQGLRRLRASFAVTFLLIAIAGSAAALVLALPIVMVILPFGPLTTLVIASMRWIVAITLVIAALGLLYRYGPNRRHARVAWLTPGALVAVAIWGIASYGLSAYLGNFGQYNRVYGALGAAIGLMIWMFLSAFCVLIGAALNAELELRTSPDSTVGPPRPAGEREAVVADDVARAN